MRRGSLDSQPNLAADGRDHRDLDVVTDHDRLVRLPGEDEHRRVASLHGGDPARGPSRRDEPNRILVASETVSGQPAPSAGACGRGATSGAGASFGSRDPLARSQLDAPAQREQLALPQSSHRRAVRYMASTAWKTPRRACSTSASIWSRSERADVSRQGTAGSSRPSHGCTSAPGAHRRRGTPADRRSNPLCHGHDSGRRMAACGGATSPTSYCSTPTSSSAGSRSPTRSPTRPHREPVKTPPATARASGEPSSASPRPRPLAPDSSAHEPSTGARHTSHSLSRATPERRR